MAHITKATHFEFIGELYQINNNAELGIYSEDLKAMLGQFEAILSYHCKVMFIRFDLHLTEYSKDNAIVSKYFNSLSPKIKREFDLKRYAYVWCREQNKAKAQHYHVGLFVDGNKYQSPHYIIEFCRELWESLDQVFSYCWSEHREENRQHFNAIRGSWEDYQEVIYWLSYLAKSYTKDKRPKTTNKYGTSRLKKRT